MVLLHYGTVAEAPYYVYLLFRWNGLPLYVGYGKGRRWTWHESKDGLTHSNKHKVRAIAKTLRLLGEVPKVKLAEGLTRAAAAELEILFIAAIGRWPNGPLLNATRGGDGVHDLSAETRRQIGATRAGKPMHPNSQRALLAYWAVHEQSPEQKAKISAALTGLKRTAEAIKKSSDGRRGAKRSAETRRKMSESAKKRAETAEGQAHLRVAGVAGRRVRWRTKPACAPKTPV